MYVEQFLVDGLGCASYMIISEQDNIAAVVDPDRDVRKYIEMAERRRVKISLVIETHLHADHVSGNTDLAARTGAPICIHEAAGVGFDHRPLHDGELLTLGEALIQVCHTPGHTPESVTLLLSDSGRSEAPWMALTGDLLFVGDVGRPDLAGPEAAQGLAADLHESLFNRLASLDDNLLVYPGHSAGSLCGQSIHSARVTSLGYERRFSKALKVKDRDGFVQRLLGRLPEQPANHHSIKAANRSGPAVLGPVSPQPLDVEAAIPFFQRGAALLDTRPKADFVTRHVPGSVHMPADAQLPNKIGFILPPGQPIILLLCGPEEYEDVVYGLRRVGYDKIPGFLAGGIAEWEAAGLPVASGDIQDVSARQLAELMNDADGSRPVVIDVREPWEYRMGHIPGSHLIPLGQLAARLDELNPDQPAAVICAHGNRSQSAAALLGQKGFARVYNVLDGMAGWQAAGLEIER